MYSLTDLWLTGVSNLGRRVMNRGLLLLRLWLAIVLPDGDNNFFYKQNEHTYSSFHQQKMKMAVPKKKNYLIVLCARA